MTNRPLSTSPFASTRFLSQCVVFQLSAGSASVGLTFLDAQDVVQQCLCLLQAVSSSSTQARDFAVTSLLPSIISVAGGIPDVCMIIFKGIMDTVEILAAASAPGAAPWAHPCICAEFHHAHGSGIAHLSLHYLFCVKCSTSSNATC